MRFWACTYLEADLDKEWGKGNAPQLATDEMHKIKRGEYDGKIIGWMQLDSPDPERGKKGRKPQQYTLKQFHNPAGATHGEAHGKLLKYFRTLLAGVMKKPAPVGGPTYELESADEYMFVRGSCTQEALWVAAMSKAKQDDIYDPAEHDAVVVFSPPFGILKGTGQNESKDVALSQEEISKVFAHAYQYTGSSTP